MGEVIKIKKGYNINIFGQAEKKVSELKFSPTIALKPEDFPTLTPKLAVEVGQEILAGQALFVDKNNENLVFSSPVSGEIAEINRGEKRKILNIKVLADSITRYKEFSIKNLDNLDRQEVIDLLQGSGCWPYIRQRPYSTIANANDVPKAMFISCFDTSPLAPDLSYIISQDLENFKQGLRVLSKLTNVHLGVQHNQDDLISGVQNLTTHQFHGPHPAGNVGIQIHHVMPIQKGDIVWYMHAQDVIVIGRLFSEGRYRADRLVALTGSEVNAPQYYQTIPGQELNAILENKISQKDNRLIQGSILSGKQSVSNDFLSFYTHQISVIPEGREPEFLGWLLPGFRKLSLSRTFFSWLFPNRTYTLDTNLHGEERAFVVTGQYDKVLPMNIYPVHLLKAILAKDIDKMEQLGIYEVAEEDFALCEFVCTSKIDVQNIIREGLEFIRKEG
jgi:Na+-transporting NADH:ubiquinone oxidoreductase subunit A